MSIKKQYKAYWTARADDFPYSDFSEIKDFFISKYRPDTKINSVGLQKPAF